MILKNDHYTYRITWDGDDQEYVGLCIEFPSLSWLDKKPESALKGIRRLIGKTIKDMKANNEKIPEPISNKHYSGRFMVRTLPEIHKRLVIQAAEYNISLNRLANSKLTN